MGWGGRLFEAGRLLTFSAFRMGAYSRWALIRINTVLKKSIMKNVHLKILLAGAFYYDVKAGLQHLAGL